MFKTETPGIAMPVSDGFGAQRDAAVIPTNTAWRQDCPSEKSALARRQLREQCVEDGGVNDISRARLFRYAAGALLVLALAYLAQFIHGAHYKGQSRMGMAFETIAHEALKRQYNGVPEMRVAGGDFSPLACRSWNFEEIWGRCASLVIHVRDYQATQQHIVEREVFKLAEQLRYPCQLLRELHLTNESDLAQHLECSSPNRSFRYQVHIDAVKVDMSRRFVMNKRPDAWFVLNRTSLFHYHFRGDF